MKSIFPLFAFLALIGNVRAAEPVCKATLPNMQAFENALFRSVETFTQGLNVQSESLPVTLGAAVSDGYGNCHLLVFLGKDKKPAGGSSVSEANYQAFVSTRMWDLGFNVENREKFIAIFKQALKDAKFDGVNSSKFETDEYFNQAIANVWNNDHDVNGYGAHVLDALQQLGLHD